MATKYHVNPRIRAYGKARIDITLRAKDEKDWLEHWRAQLHPYPFAWGDGWKFCIEYKVDDFAAEVGFFIDFLGFPASVFSPNYAQFTSPNGEFFFSVSAVQEGEQSTPPDTLRIQFNIADIVDTVEELESRGIVFEQHPQPIREGSEIVVGYFRTPHGVCIDLWGVREPELVRLQANDLGEDEIDDILNDILHQAEESAEEGHGVNSEDNDRDNLSSVSQGASDSRQADRKSNPTRFPNSIEKSDFTKSPAKSSNLGEHQDTSKYHDKIGSTSQPDNTVADELTYQEIDE